MNPYNCGWKVRMMNLAICLTLLGSLAYAVKPRPIVAGQKAKITCTIQSRDGDLIRVREKKIVSLTDGAEIERQKGNVAFFRHSDMDVTTTLAGLTIEAEGVGDASLDAAA